MRMRTISLVAIAAIATLALATRLALLSRMDGLVGYDAYFYAVQTRDLLETGKVTYPDSSLVYLLLHAVARATGDVPLAVRFVAALGGAVLPIPVYFLGLELSRRRLIGLVAAALSAASTVHLYFSFEFLKSAWSLVPFAAGLALLARAERTKSRAPLALAIAAFVVAALTHRAMVALAVVALVPFSASAAVRAWRRSPRWTATGLVVCLVASARLPAFTSCVRFVAADVSWPSFALLEIARGPGSFYGIAYVVEVALYHAVVVVLVAFAFASVFRRGPLVARPATAKMTWSLVLLLAVLLFPFWSHDWMGLFFRLLRLALVPSLGALALIAARVPNRVAWGVGLVAIGCVALEPRLADRYARAHPDYEKGRAAVEALGARLPKNSRVVAPHGWQFFVTFVTRLPATSKPVRDVGDVWILDVDDPVLAPGADEVHCATDATAIELTPGFRARPCTGDRLRWATP